MEDRTSSELVSAVARARKRAGESGELKPAGRGLDAVPVSGEFAKLVRRVLSDGTYAQAVEQIGREDPDLATL
jgi:hypothetical protein